MKLVPNTNSAYKAVLVAMIIIVLLGVFVPSGTCDDLPVRGATTDQVVASGEELVYEGGTEQMSSNVTVKAGGSLIIRNTVLEYEYSTDGACSIKAEAGSSLIIEGSTITGMGLLAVQVWTDDAVINGSTFSDFYLGAFFINCTATITNSTFSFITFDQMTVSNSKVTICDCSFDQSEANGIHASQDSEVLIEGCTFTSLLLSNVYGLEASSIEIVDSVLKGPNTGAFIVDSPVSMEGTKVEATNGVYQMMSSTTLFPLADHRASFTGCSFEGIRQGSAVKLSDITNIEVIGCSFHNFNNGLDTSMGLPGLVLSDVVVEDSDFLNVSSAIFLSDASGEVRNVTIHNSTYYATTLSDSFCTVTNLTVTGSSVGMFDSGSNAKVTSCIFSGNDIGMYLGVSSSQVSSNTFKDNVQGVVISQDTVATLNDNIIHGNSDWGVILYDWDMDVSDNDYGDGTTAKPYNTNGRTVVYSSVDVFVVDAYSMPVGMANLSVTSDQMDTPIIRNTSVSGDPVSLNLINYDINNAGSMQVHTYEIVAKGWNSETTYVLTPAAPTMVTMTLRLPNARLDLSSATVVGELDTDGGELTVTVDIVNDGDVDMTDLTVYVTIGGAIIGSERISTLGARQTQTLVIECTSGGVPDILVDNGTVEVKVQIKTDEDQEYSLMTDRYVNDNAMTVKVPVEVKEEGTYINKPARARLAMVFIGIGFALIILVFIFSRLLVKRMNMIEAAKKEQKPEKFIVKEEDDLDEEEGPSKIQSSRKGSRTSREVSLKEKGGKGKKGGKEAGKKVGKKKGKKNGKRKPKPLS